MNKICLLKPDVASTDEITPWLHKIEKNQWYTNFGPLNTEFEQGLCRELNLEYGHVTTTANGTSALQLSLEALNLPANANILIPALTFVATAVAIIKAGLRPMIADINPDNWLLDTEKAYQALQTHNIKAVVPVAAFGVPLEISSWDHFAEQTGIPVVIDAAGAFGNQPVLAKHTTVIFSLHTTKTLSAGEGGVVVSPQKEVIESIRSRSNFGIDYFQSGQATSLGFNAKLSEYHAAIGLANLNRWWKSKQKRLKLLGIYMEKINKLDLNIQFQKGIEDCILSIFNIRLAPETNVDSLRMYLLEKGVDARRWYYPLIPYHDVFSELPCIDDLENANQISQQILGLPFHLQLTQQNINHICRCLVEFYKRKGI